MGSTKAEIIVQQLSDPHQLEALLLQLCAPDTQQIAQAEGIVKKYVKNPVCVQGLIQQMQASKHAQVRQLAAMLLRRRLSQLWNKLDSAVKENIKTSLLAGILQETERPIRKNVACVIAVVAKRLLKQNKWNELLAFIHQLGHSEVEDQRELAFILLLELGDTLGKGMEGNLQSLKQFYMVALQDASRKVQVMALKACAALLMALLEDDSAGMFQDLVPGMLAVARLCLEQGDEDTVSQVLDVFSELVSTYSSSVASSVVPLVHFCLEVLRTDALQNTTRDVAGMVVTALAQYKPKTLGKKNLVHDIVATLLHVMAVCQDNAAGELLSNFYRGEAEEDDDEDPDYEGGPSGQDIAQQCLDTLALHVPAKYFYAPTMALIGQGLDSPDPNMRKAGTAALGVIVEGCHEEITKQLPTILPRVVAAARDPAVAVRECVCFLLGQLSENCQPEILDYHTELMPIIFSLLEDTTLSVQATSCHVLETLCEHMSKQCMTPYLEPLLVRLHRLLQVPKTAVQEAAIGAIAAVATGAEEGFIPYLREVAPMMAQLLPLTDERVLKLKGRALDCMARMALAVGKAEFAPYVDASIQAAGQCFALPDQPLHEEAFLAFAQFVRVLGDDFAVHLPSLIPKIFEILEESDGEVVWLEDEEEEGVSRLLDGVDDEEEEGSPTKVVDLNGAGEEEDDEDDEDGQAVYDVRTGLLDIKKAAIFCLGELAEYGGVAFAPFLEKSIEQLGNVCRSLNSALREEAASALPHMLLNASAAAPPSREWVKGDLTDVMAPPTRAVTHAVLELLLGLFESDEDEDVVVQCLASLQAMLEHAGPGLLANETQRDRFMTYILQLLKGGLPCQQSAEEDEDVGEEDGEENSRGLVESCCDLIGAVAKTWGPAALVYLDQMMEPLVQYTAATKPEEHRQSASGCLGEMAEGLGPEMQRYFRALLPVVKLGLADGSTSVRRNSAWTMGLLYASVGQEAAPFAMEILQALHPVFSDAGDDKGEALDNATSAVARMIMTTPAALPLGQILPSFLQALPLRADMNENECVYRCLAGLLQSNIPEVKASIPAVVGVYGRLLAAADGLQDEVKTGFVIPGMQAVFHNPEYREAAVAAVHTLAPDVQSLLAQFLQG